MADLLLRSLMRAMHLHGWCFIKNRANFSLNQVSSKYVQMAQKYVQVQVHLVVLKMSHVKNPTGSTEV